jgi:hypothetical protein
MRVDTTSRYPLLASQIRAFEPSYSHQDIEYNNIIIVINKDECTKGHSSIERERESIMSLLYPK